MLSQCIWLNKFNKQYRYKHMITVLKSAKEGHLQWACDRCLKKKLALRGHPRLQNWGGFAYPYFAFYDQHKVCTTCHLDFAFKKEEQEYWYEKMQFIVWSFPKDCAACRKQNRAPKVRNTKISHLVKNLQKDNIEQVEQLIELYLEIDKIEKAKYYLALVRKNSDYSNNSDLRLRLESIKERISIHIKP